MHFLQEIMAYQPQTEQEIADQQVFLQCLTQDQMDFYQRSNQIAHFTSSAFILNSQLDKTLMVFHRLYQTWTMCGGHADGEQDLYAVAIKEAQEECGIQNLRPIRKEIAAIDILPVKEQNKNGIIVPAHRHFSVTYLFFADEEQEIHPNEMENTAADWLLVKDLDFFCKEPYMRALYAKLLQKAKNWVFDSYKKEKRTK